MKPCYVLQKELIFNDGVILQKQKLVIPHCLRCSFLRLAHEGHIGIVKRKAILGSWFVEPCLSAPYRFWSLVFYFGMPLVPNRVGSSPTGSNDADSNARVTMVISSCRFMWSISNWRNFTNSIGLLFSISINWDFKKCDFCNYYF